MSSISCAWVRMTQSGDLNTILGRREQGAEEVEEHKMMGIGANPLRAYVMRLRIG